MDGLRRLRADLRRAGEDLRDLREVNRRAGELVARAAAPLARRRTGRLAGAGRAAAAANRVSVLWGGASVPYAGPLHWGWPARGITPDPFVSEAAQATEAAWLGMYQDELEDAFRSMYGRTY